MRKFQEAGLTWIGPSAEVLEKMNAKITAREIASSVGCPVLPGIHETLDDEDLMAEAKKLGFPLMLKPVAGRDGKGMRLVKSPGELRRALPRVKGDALFSFWDERVYLEKALIHPRHIDIQIAGDSHGNYVYLWEREGSVQRRFQQVADEAPSVSLNPEQRRAMGEAAVAIARKVGYVGLGTVEFLLDGEGHFYFLEMTCRIQGGHAVTEWITGQDLVKWQIQIARGEKLPLAQDQIPMWGHAIQCRINAEDPDRDFAPSSGRIIYLRTPAGHRLRDDNGVYTGWDAVALLRAAAVQALHLGPDPDGGAGAHALRPERVPGGRGAQQRGLPQGPAGAQAVPARAICTPGCWTTPGGSRRSWAPT